MSSRSLAAPLPTEASPAAMTTTPAAAPPSHATSNTAPQIQSDAPKLDTLDPIRSDGPAAAGEMTDVQRERIKLFEASSDLQDLCEENGLSVTQFARRSTVITELEMFLGFWPSMLPVAQFPALKELRIIKHPSVVKLEGLTSCPLLEVLCVTECGLTRIEEVAQCTRLRALNLSGNAIVRIENLEPLVALDSLWLNDNRIEKLEGLWCATMLRSLWLCRNRIERIDSALNACVALTELNLADNRVCSFKTLLSLANLDQLTMLTLSDPHFGDNPVCRLCNYQTYLMCQLNRLTHLDTMELSIRNKQIAEATMIKKKMYYNMRIKAIKREVDHRIRRVESVRCHTEQRIETSIDTIVLHKKELEQWQWDARHRNPSTTFHPAAPGSDDTNTLSLKMIRLEAYVQAQCASILRMNRAFEAVRERLQWTADVNISRLLLELDTGGNIRLETGRATDAWHASCVDLVRSRLFARDLAAFGIGDVHVNRVTRISNRFLRNRFHARMEEILVVNEDDVKANVSKKGVTVSETEERGGSARDSREPQPRTGLKGQRDDNRMPGNSLEYLFYTQPPLLDHMRNAEPEQFYAAECGFRDPDEYYHMGLEGAIKLSNSMAMLDTPRLMTALAARAMHLQRRELSLSDYSRISTLTVQEQEHALRHEMTREMRDAAKQAAAGEWELPMGVLLVVKVFPGYSNCVSAQDEKLTKPIDAKDYPGTHSLLVTRPPNASSVTATVGPNAEESMTQTMYYMFDKGLVLPEYLVEYQYIPTSAMTTLAIANTSNSDIAPRDASSLRTQPTETAQTPQPASVVTRSTLSSDDSGDLGVAARLADEFERQYRYRRPLSTSSEMDCVGNHHPTGGYPSRPQAISPEADEDITKLLQMEPIVSSYPSSSSSSVSYFPPLDDKTPVSPRTFSKAGPSTIAVPTRITITETSRLTHLTLLGCGLDHVPDLSSCHDHLEVLVLSYNSIESLPSSLAVLTKLRHLDISNNRISKLDSLGPLEALESLELEHNQLSSFADIEYLGQTRKSATMTKLDLRKNRLCATKRYRLHVLRLIPHLALLDKQAVSHDESIAAQRLVTKLSPQVLWAQHQSTKRVHVTEDTLTKVRVKDQSVVRSNDVPSNEEPCWTTVEEIFLNRELIPMLEGLDHCINLRVASFADNVISRILGLKSCTRLEELSLEDNEIVRVENLETLVVLKRLNLGRNRLVSIDHLDRLENLTQLSLENNQISSLRGLSSAMKLMELYIGNNRIEVLKEVQHLKTLPKLTILDLSGNELTHTADYRIYTVYYLRRVKVLDGSSVTPQDQSDAKQKYSGKLSMEFISEKCGSTSMDRIQEMNLSSCRIREIGSIHGKIFTMLSELNLENNQISDVSGLDSLPRLRVLNLNRNRIDRLLLGDRATLLSFTAPDPAHMTGILSCLKLEQLFLAYNQINDMTLLGLQFLDDLKVLHLQGNAIVFVAGLDTSINLLELRLDKNKIRQLDSQSTTAIRKLKVLSLEDNALKTLPNFSDLASLEFLDVSNNRVSDLDELDKLGPLVSLVEMRMMNNPVTKKYLYRQTVLYKIDTLRILDGREVLSDERERVDILFQHERATAALVADRHGSGVPFTIPPASVPGKFAAASGIGAGLGGSASGMPMMVATSNAARTAVAQQVATGEVFTGSQLRKNVNANPNTAHALHSFAKPEQATDANVVIAIAPSYTTTKSLLAHMGTNASLRGGYLSTTSSSNQTSSGTATVGSAFSSSLSSTGGDSFHLGALRSDRRRISSVQYDQSCPTGYPSTNSVGMATGANSVSSNLISSHPLLRGSSTKGNTIHPLSADAPSRTGASVAAYSKQKRYGGMQEPAAAMDLATALANASANKHNASRR